MQRLNATTTEDQLLKIYGAPIVKLADICEQYLGNKHYQARVRANMNALPFPAFRLDPTSHKSPWMVSLHDLAEFIDARSNAGRVLWKKSQL